MPAGLLTCVVRATSAAADADVLLDRVAEVLVGHADWVLADRLDDPDLVTRVSVRSRDGRHPLPQASGARPRRSAAGAVGLLPLLRTSPQRVLRLTEQDLRGHAASEDAHRAAQARAALESGARDLVVVGLVARDQLVGVLTVGSRTRLPEDVVAALPDVGLHVGTALDAARLLTAQRAVATAMQTSLLPPVPHVDGLRLAARYLPAGHELEVGGDWYDAFPTAGGLTFAVGDVRGHDLSAAAQMADLRNLLRAHAVDRDEPPSALLGRLERTLEALGLDVVATCVVGRAARTDAGWRVQLSSAGHLPPVLCSGGRARLVEPEAELMLGVHSGSPRTDTSHDLGPGDVLVLCTDGLVEVRDVGLDARLEVLRATVEQHADTSPDLLAEHLLALAPHAEDDVALLVLRVDG